MMVMLRWMPLVVLAAAAWVVPASAQAQAPSPSEARQRCVDPNPETAIAGCTAMIESRREGVDNRAVAFLSRGNAYNGLGQYDRAIEDYDQAILLKPSYAKAFVNRGNAWLRKGDPDRAIQDYDEALRLDPSDTIAQDNRRVAVERKAGK